MLQKNQLKRLVDFIQMVRSNNENTIYDEGCDVNNKNSVELAAQSMPACAPKPSREFARFENDNNDNSIMQSNNFSNSQSESQSISFEEVKEGGGDDDSLLMAKERPDPNKLLIRPFTEEQGNI